MSTHSDNNTIGTKTASVDLSAKQYSIVKVSGANTIAGATAATDRPCGILQNNPVSGGPAAFRRGGSSLLTAGAAFAAGAELMSDGSGRGITATGSGAIVAAIALEAATAINQIVEVLPIVGGRILP
jgi:hypothetical protein